MNLNKRELNYAPTPGRCLVALGLLLLLLPGLPIVGQTTNDSSYKFNVPDRFANQPIDAAHPVDAGSTNHTINDFPPEPKDVFHLMDQVADSNEDLHPIDFGVANGVIDPSSKGQKAIYGRNTWLLWCGGNEDFWDWLSQDAYGVLDFLKMIDSRKRESRFRDLGLINQPGMKASTKPGPYGLYLDTVERRIGEEGGYSPYSTKLVPGRTGPEGLESDGVNPAVYGYPSGIIGLRLFPNPKFDEAARRRWNPEAFYNDPVYSKDPRTVRPFLVGMSCALCHVAIHPLNPPVNPEEPLWANLSSIIGNQYFRTSSAFGSPVERGNFLWYYLAAQQPGTIDTSMVTTDHINNANAMNPVFELPARIDRALLNPAEDQGAPARTFPGSGDGVRKVPRVLMEGADSVGVFGALARVFLNIGLFHDEWNLCSNPVIGFVGQRPFSIDVCRRNSVYWRVNENFRVGYLAEFFLWDNRTNVAPGKSKGKRIQASTAGMHLDQARAPQCSIELKLLGVGEKPTPKPGRLLYALGKDVNGHLKVTIYDANGQFAVEKDETGVTGKDSQWEALRTATAHYSTADAISDDHKAEILETVSSLVEYSPKFISLPENKHHWDPDRALDGSRVFVRNCMICHSSKQPVGFNLTFSQKPPGGAQTWDKAPENPNSLCLPYNWQDWEIFKKSPSYKAYVDAAMTLSGAGNAAKVKEFIAENFLSTDLRIPVTLVGTCAARALATNGKEGQVWAEYSSTTYKQLPSVGLIPYYDPFSHTTNFYKAPGNGPGFYRPASLVGVWATAPLLHNNSLGFYLPDWDEARRVSVEGRLAMFDDAINKLLWKSKRELSPSGEAGLRDPSPSVWHGKDPGWIFRTDMETELRIPRGHIRHLIVGTLPGLVYRPLVPLVLGALDYPWAPPLLLGVFSLGIRIWNRRFYFYLLVTEGAVLLAVLWLTGLGYLLPWVIWIPPLTLIVGGWLWVDSAPSTSANASSQTKPVPSWEIWAKTFVRWSAIVSKGLILVGLFAALWVGRTFVNGQICDLVVGPFPKGVPVNALMNLDPDSPFLDRLGALRGIMSTIGKLRADDLRPKEKRFTDEQRLAIFEAEAGPALMKVSKCPDFIMDRGHYFGEALSDADKVDLIAFLKTL